MHHSEECSSGHTAGEASNSAGFQVYGEGVAEAFCHKRDALVVGRIIGAFPEVSEHLHVLRKMVEWAPGSPLREQDRTSDQHYDELSHETVLS